MEEHKRDQAWALLKLIAVARHGNEAWREAEELIQVGSFDHNALIGEAARHSLLETVAAFVADIEADSSLPNRTLKHLARCLWANKLVTSKCLNDAAEISSALGSQGIRFAFTKGIVCQQTIYNGSGARLFNDVDMMVHPDDARRVADTLVCIGFAEGQSYDGKTGAFYPNAKSRSALYRLNPDHLPHFLRRNPQSLPQITIVDVALSLTWHGSRWQVPLDDAMTTLRTVHCDTLGDKVALPALSLEADFLFHLLHLFREGWFERTAARKDIRLSQFADIVRIWDSFDSEARSTFIRLVRRTEVEPPVAWSLHHADALFGTSIAEDCGLLEFCEDGWISSLAGRGGFKRWHGDIDRRLRESSFSLEPLQSLPKSVAPAVQQNL